MTEHVITTDSNGAPDTQLSYLEFPTCIRESPLVRVVITIIQHSPGRIIRHSLHINDHLTSHVMRDLAPADTDTDTSRPFLSFTLSFKVRSPNISNIVDVNER